MPQPLYSTFPDSADAIYKLKQRVEAVMNSRMQTPRDFDTLSEAVFGRMRTLISPTTLKRMWGYIDEPVQPRRSTLDVLSRFVGYPDFRRFSEGLATAAEVQSDVTLAYSINTTMLSRGSRITLRWLPDRRCRVRHLGDGRFEVEEAENTKLSVGDTFRCLLMVEGEPLYLDALVHLGQPPVTYIAGRKDGIRIER
ncbi:MAG: hypothetical protein Q4E59_06395 [Bacteroidales bacterium]|nr:hypothetical protein [Bacteroidales bacterium]